MTATATPAVVPAPRVRGHQLKTTGRGAALTAACHCGAAIDATGLTAPVMDDLRARYDAHKAEVLAALAADQPAQPAEPAQPAPLTETDRLAAEAASLAVDDSDLVARIEEARLRGHDDVVEELAREAQLRAELRAATR